jgi:vitamin B12 transporter
MTSLKPTKAVASRRLLAVAVAAAWSCHAFAQSEPALSRVEVTSARAPQPVRDALADTSVITADDIAASGQTSLVELLRQQRGVEVSMSGGPGTQSSVFLRGTANNQNLVLIDGVRVGSSAFGGATWQALPLSQIDHIEIVRGPLSTLYGADAVGGVIQIFTRRGEGAPQANVSAGLGSYRTRELSGGLSGGTGGDHPFSYAVQVGTERSDGFNATKPSSSPYSSFNPDRDGYTRDSASGRFALGLAAGHELGFSFLQSRLNAQFDAGAPYADDRNISKVGVYALTSRNQFLPNWKSTLQLARSTDRTDTRATFGDSAAHTRQDQLSWQNDITLGTDLLQLLAERRVEHVDTDPNSGVTASRGTNAFAAIYQLRRGAHLASASLRNDDNSQFGSKTTGSIAYGYKFSEAWKLNASYGTSFRAPTFFELYYPGYGLPTLKPESGRNLEAGVSYASGRNNVSATVYRNRVSDLIVNAFPCPVVSDAYSFGCAYNVNEALITGITLGASTGFGPYTVRGSLDVQDPHDANTGKLLARRSRQHGVVAFDYASGKLRGSVETEFSGKRYDDPANQTRLGGYALLNLVGSYAINRDWTVVARWNNVLNKDYELVKDYATAGSNVFVALRYGWR